MDFSKNDTLDVINARYNESFNVIKDTRYDSNSDVFYNYKCEYLFKSYKTDTKDLDKTMKKRKRFIRKERRLRAMVEKLGYKAWKLKCKYCIYLPDYNENVDFEDDLVEEIEEENEVNVANVTVATETENKPEEDGDNAVDSGEKKEIKEEDKPEDLGDKPKDTGVKKDKVAKDAEAIEIINNVANETVATEKKNIEALFK